MATPKKKTSQSRKGMRRSHHAIAPVNAVECKNCGNMTLPHTVCPSCGYYDGAQVVAAKKPKKQAEAA
ncbi:50S ribosomal protein L32 [Alphaproteobacteria bacterium]|nr:50S ribosomal protein L32 [Alphaproteobacteria bacterium]